MKNQNDAFFLFWVNAIGCCVLFVRLLLLGNKVVLNVGSHATVYSNSSWKWNIQSDKRWNMLLHSVDISLWLNMSEWEGERTSERYRHRASLMGSELLCNTTHTLIPSNLAYKMIFISVGPPFFSFSQSNRTYFLDEKFTLTHFKFMTQFKQRIAFKMNATNITQIHHTHSYAEQKKMFEEKRKESENNMERLLCVSRIST